MLLVPRQLRRSGMTGSAPYYGGRLTPTHIQGLPRPRRPAPPPGSPVPGGPPVPGPPPGARSDVRPPLPGPAVTPGGISAALEYLLNAHVITRAEFEALRAR